MYCILNHVAKVFYGNGRLGMPVHICTPCMHHGHHEQSVAARHGVRSVECVLGALPVMHPSLSSSDCAAQASVALRGEAARKLQWSRLHCDHACGPWRSFLLLMMEGVAMHEGEVLFPNQIWHRGRTVHNVTEHGLLYLLSDPLLSEVGLLLALVSMIQRHCQSLDLSSTSEYVHDEHIFTC
jgi:hypothetical protein